MNERIKKLAALAQIDEDAIHYYSPAFAEKFAELIIKECMELGDKALQDGKWPGDVLKEYFGVER